MASAGVLLAKTSSHHLILYFIFFCITRQQAKIFFPPDYLDGLTADLDGNSIGPADLTLDKDTMNLLKRLTARFLIARWQMFVKRNGGILNASLFSLLYDPPSPVNIEKHDIDVSARQVKVTSAPRPPSYALALSTTEACSIDILSGIFFLLCFLLFFRPKCTLSRKGHFILDTFMENVALCVCVRVFFFSFISQRLSHLTCTPVYRHALPKTA